ncbi:anti-sigma factor family protein [Rhizobium grahamii]|uniref:Fis family transcriptional regulator n=1 Tax=Rhizobium grahamii TaxID=1120045 RepID=A0A370KVE6_9HYPH|nr:anti-sigma factor [Rhizobium grahamii]RDJ15465.1 Fis family transcriptional regulator [Rhizobium grahamii]
MNDKNKIPSDEELTAYIDGELSNAEVSRIEAVLSSDEHATARLAFLSQSSLSFQQAFEPLLSAAPKARLDAMLGILPAEARPVPARSNRRGFLAALAACLVAGVVADRAVIGIRNRVHASDESNEWRAVVAEYIALYTPDTLAGPSPSGEAQVAQLARLDDKLGLSLSPEAVSLPGIEFKRAQMLQYDEKPLAQIAYLDPETGPLALCIVRSDVGMKEPDVEGRNGMNVVYWSNATHAFMLIGRIPIDRMQELADGVRARISA